MLEFRIIVDGKHRSAKRRPKRRVTRFEALVAALDTLGVRIIPNVDAVQFRGRRLRLDAGRHGYEMRDLAGIVHRKFGYRPSPRFLVDTLRSMRIERCGR